MRWIECDTAGVQQASHLGPNGIDNLPEGRAAFIVPDDFTGDLSAYDIDLTQTPPVMVLRPPPADSPADSAPDSP